MIHFRRILVCLLILNLSACVDAPPPQLSLIAVTNTPTPTTKIYLTSTQTLSLILPPKPWQERAVIPTKISPRMIEVYNRGLAIGNNSQSFSKIGDGNASADWFLADFDHGTSAYKLGEYEHLQITIEFFQNSFAHRSLSAGRGFNTLSLFDPIKADKQLCQIGETPLDCELRIHKPAIALILMGTNQDWRADEFEDGMRRILDRLILHGVIPILSTKADNLEGDGQINAIIAALADEYEVPLWNFWSALQPLPNHGLQMDNEHLTWAGNNFENPLNLESGWAWRNLSALQILERMRTWIGDNGK